MIVRKLSPTGDFTFGSSLLNFWVNSPQGVAQIVKTSLLLWVGEWYLDTTQGMPWIEGVLGKHNQETADITVQDYVLGIDNVTNIQNFQSTDTQNIRLYAASFLLNTTFGPTQAQITNGTLY